MKKFEGIFLCTDMDGTLLKNDKTLSEENLRAIEFFKSEGGLFTFITGRHPIVVEKYYNIIKPNTPIGCINGGGIFDFQTRKYLWKKQISDRVIELLECVESNIDGIGIQVNTFENIYFCTENSAMEYFRAVTGISNLSVPYKQISEPIAKVCLVDFKKDNLEYAEMVLKSHPAADEFDFVASEDYLYEILPKGSNKGNLFSTMIDILGIDKNKAIAVGDYYNDVEMLSEARFGIAVSNACDEAKSVADYITVSNEENAIAQIISDIETGAIML